MKCGDNANDTGYMRLRGVRIPRAHLLCKRHNEQPEASLLHAARDYLTKSGPIKRPFPGLRPVGTENGNKGNENRNREDGGGWGVGGSRDNSMKPPVANPEQ